MQELADALSLGHWPEATATPAELIWCSESLRCADFHRLYDYSVFWHRTDEGVFLWISREPKIPSGDESLFRTGEILNALVVVYRVYISKDHQEHHEAAMIKYRKSITRLRRKRLTTAALLYIFGISIVVAYTWAFRRHSTADFTISLTLYIAQFTFGTLASSFAARRLGSGFGLMAMISLLLFALYMVVVVRSNLSENIRPEFSTDVLALLFGVVLGIFVSELRQPGVTVRDVIARGGLRGLYTDIIVPTSLVIGPAFGALKLTEYIIGVVSADVWSGLYLVPIAGMLLVALFEFTKREVLRKD